MTPVRTTAGINKREDAGMIGTQIWFADALRRIFPTALASYLQFRGWICRETLCGRSLITIYLRQCVVSDAFRNGTLQNVIWRGSASGAVGLIVVYQLPSARATSASRILLFACSGVCLLLPISPSFAAQA